VLKVLSCTNETISTHTMQEGNHKEEVVNLPDRFRVDVSGGDKPVEISWQFVVVNRVLISGWAPYIGLSCEEQDRIIHDSTPEPTPEPTTIFGPVEGDPVVFVIDKSGSMNSIDTFNGVRVSRDSLCYEELAHSLGGLSSSSRFNVVKYAAGASKVFPDVELATLNNVDRALREMKGGVGGGTNTLDALREAFNMPTAPEKIYFLSDGIPMQATQTILNEVASLDKGRGIPVNTILLHPDHSGAEAKFMESLAKQTGGVFKAVNLNS